MAIHTDVYTTHGGLQASSCGVNSLPQPILEFGFPALGLRVNNVCAQRLFVNLAGQAATTAHGYLTSGEVLYIAGADAAFCGLGLTTTTTATGTTAGPLYSAMAWRSA